MEMVRGDVHAAIQIEAVRGEALDVRIKGKIFAPLFLRMLDEPIEKRGAEPARAVGIVGDEIVDVESAAGEKEIQDAKAGDGTDRPVELEIGELVAFLLLLENARGEIYRLDVRAQFAHDGGATADLFWRGGERDFP